MTDINNTVRKLFEEYIFSISGKRVNELDIVIYGVEMQTCGGLLKYIDKDMPIRLISYDLRNAGYIYDNQECRLPEECMPYSENTIVLVSLLYEYQYREIQKKLENVGITHEKIFHARPFAEELLKLCAEYYAQNRMDLKVKELFDGIKRDISEIKYIDIGANNYLLYNNTYLFYKAGASGVLVEANPDFADILRDNRPRDAVLMCGCSDSDNYDGMTYYKTNRAGYNTFVKEIAAGYKEKGIEIVEEINIPMYSINGILEKYFPDGHIDYMSIDIEGMGDKVLDSIDFSKYDIDILLVEMEFASDFSRNVYLKLKDMGYVSQYRGIGSGKDFLFYKYDVFAGGVQ